MNPSELSTLTVPLATVQRCDRWQACHRLQELSIPCHCTADGCLQVEIEHAIAILQVRSVIQQITVPRAELVDWLDRCWQTPYVDFF